jgi:hypothetical protein
MESHVQFASIVLRYLLIDRQKLVWRRQQLRLPRPQSARPQYQDLRRINASTARSLRSAEYVSRPFMTISASANMASREPSVRSAPPEMHRRKLSSQTKKANAYMAKRQNDVVSAKVKLLLLMIKIPRLRQSQRVRSVDMAVTKMNAPSALLRVIQCVGIVRPGIHARLARRRSISHSAWRRMVQKLWKDPKTLNQKMLQRFMMRPMTQMMRRAKMEKSAIMVRTKRSASNALLKATLSAITGRCARIAGPVPSRNTRHVERRPKKTIRACAYMARNASDAVYVKVRTWKAMNKQAIQMIPTSAAMASTKKTALNVQRKIIALVNTARQGDFASHVPEKTTKSVSMGSRSADAQNACHDASMAKTFADVVSVRSRPRRYKLAICLIRWSSMRTIQETPIHNAIL